MRAYAVPPRSAMLLVLEALELRGFCKDMRVERARTLWSQELRDRTEGSASFLLTLSTSLPQRLLKGPSLIRD